MNKSFSQDFRMGQLLTDLGPDVLALMRFEGSERLNDLFDWQVDCLAATDEIDFDTLIGTHATVTLQDRQARRCFDGIVTEARWMGVGENGHRYRLRLQPWLKLASLRRNQRIFHNQTVTQILEELLSAYGDAGKLVVETSADYPVLEYTVQFRESDMAFACRLMERHGISYHFRHAAGAHCMVLTDCVADHESIGRRDFHASDTNHRFDEEHFWDWQPARRITTGAVRLTDYNFKTPNAAMEVDQQGDATHDQGRIESFDWPGDYRDPGQGRVVAQLRMQSERGQDRRYEAIGDVLTLGAGGRVTLAGDPVPGHGETYLCLAATHSYTSDNYGTGGQKGDELAYRGRYVLMPDTAPLVPERKTPLADVRGPQTAVVVGAEGEEIDCDEYGRILVRFHWDLEGAWSMRCRVSQSWAGNGWGGMVIPRVGMEVVVEFLDGDPDQPLVTGCVYNGRNKVPYELPANKTRSTFRTDTHKGDGFNELRLEDEAGREEIFVHAQKDRNEKVRNNHSERIDNNWLQSVGGDKSIIVENDHDEIVGGNLTLSVGTGAAASAVTKNLSRFTQGIGGLAKALGMGKLPMLGRGNTIIQTERNRVDITGLTHTETVGLAKTITSGGRINLHAAAHVDIHGDNLAELNSAGTTSVSAGERITINCGEAHMTLEHDGSIHIHGLHVNISATESMHLSAGNSMVIKSGQTLKIESGRVDIN